MIRGTLSMAFAIVLLASPLRVWESQQADVDVQSEYVYGSGVDNLMFEGEPDEHGLIWSIHEPNEIHEPWAVTVYNASKNVASNLTITVEFQVDGDWYPVTLDAYERLMSPISIRPGTIAFTDAGLLAAATLEWNDVRVIINSFKRGSSDLGTSLTLEELETNRSGGYSGIVDNHSGHSVSHITYSFACVDKNGRIVNLFNNSSELRRLDAGDEEEFAFSEANGSCDSDSDVMVSVDARIRD